MLVFGISSDSPLQTLLNGLVNISSPVQIDCEFDYVTESFVDDILISNN